MSETENTEKDYEELTKGKQIRHIRKSIGLTQSEFSVILNVSKNAESDWENGKYEPNAVHWKIIKALPDVRVDGNEELQLAFLKVLPLCPACQKVAEDYIRKFYKVLREKAVSLITNEKDRPIRSAQRSVVLAGRCFFVHCMVFKNFYHRFWTLAGVYK